MTNQSSRSRLVGRIGPRLAIVVALGALVLSMDGTWSTQPALAAPTTQPAAAPPRPGGAAAPDERSGGARPVKKEVTGKLNLNTATEEQLMMLPTVGPSKAERIVVWRKKNGGFKRTADLRRVKGFGYRTYKRLEPFLDIKGDTTLAAKH
jgi:competence ComEA-like helix-hairpin-helix protein